MQADVHQTRIQDALAELGVSRRIVFFVDDLSDAVETPRQREVRCQAERHAQAVDVLQRDPHVVELKQAFGAQLVETSVKPVDESR
ncbi:MAG: DNA polymerase III gamma and tau subunits DnaX [Halomonas sp. HL-93]|nr:MAG: DNA polymerase III gamma and tau subunits DnaX [Halomonas sp. HL-93]